MTRPYAEVIGDPIAHSKSPLIHNFWLKKLGIDAEYRACHVRPEELADYFAQRRGDSAWRGCNVTLPHKVAVLPCIDSGDDQAMAVGAINTVYRTGTGALVGTNTDVDGVEAAIRSCQLDGAEVCIIGAGGASRAAMFALSRRRCAAVMIMARDPEKAVRVSRSFDIPGVGVPLVSGSTAFAGASLVINATQLGMSGADPMPDFILHELAEMDPDGTVFDMVYAPIHTELLAAAAARSLGSVGGLTMLVGQAAVAFARFFDAPAPREHDAELRALLTQ